jgi:2',3'-cyclic-nucleotide 2'-phosphodiesterase (5'-nucleotidase family)
MNMMGYDGMALGPQDLALGLEVIRQRITEAEFAMLSANAVVSVSGALVAPAYKLHEFNGHTVAIAGLSGDGGTSEIAIRDPMESARIVVADLATKADVIVLLSNAGTLVDQKIAEEIPGIDLIISGGKFLLNTPWRSAVTGTLILHADQASAGHAGRRLGIAQLTFDGAGHMFEHKWQRLTLGPVIASDPATEKWVKEQTGP